MTFYLRSELACGAVRFVPRDKASPLVALASFPGSGNTWLRHLVHLSTGLKVCQMKSKMLIIFFFPGFYTGSEYFDYDLHESGFLGEGVRNRSAILVKTHDSDEVTRSRYDKVVLLMRSPRAAILAEFNRVYSGDHRGLASRENFLKYWSEFSSTHQKAWRQFYSDWLLYPRPLTLVHFEDLVKDPGSQLRRVLEVVGVSGDPGRLQCSLRGGVANLWRRGNYGSSTESQDDLLLYNPETAYVWDMFYKEIVEQYNIMTQKTLIKV
ncbi:WSC domain-containing protein 2 [Aplysia californica]|uniref:WSC domain-containing protein 2 n=1 Tax=Aplysia californica TaxID=6500 RepID=A0ABM1W4V7_APLCA|nr:WSC domain-containing protein 2 [Aplysia californica]